MLIAAIVVVYLIIGALVSIYLTWWEMIGYECPPVLMLFGWPVLGSLFLLVMLLVALDELIKSIAGKRRS